MKLFGKRAAGPARPALVRTMSAWSGGEWPRTYEAQVRDGYLGNPIAQRAVRIVAEGASGLAIYGRIEWIDGANSGLAGLIAASDGATLTLRDPPAYDAPAGTRVRLTEGCDRMLATCRDRFANVANFRGEPWLPGNDLLTRYPGA